MGRKKPRYQGPRPRKEGGEAYVKVQKRVGDAKQRGAGGCRAWGTGSRADWGKREVTSDRGFVKGRPLC